MRAAALGSLLLLAVACNPLSGGSDEPGSTSTSQTPTTPDGSRGGGSTDPKTSGDDVQGSSSGTCARYVTCIAQTSPSLLGTVTDTYGKSGSCWSEMSAGECEDACKLGLEQAGCPTCDPSSASCLGETCKSSAECATGELCAGKTCIIDAHLQKCATSSCPAPYECQSLDGSETPDMQRCVIPCDGHRTDECPAGFICNGGGCMNSDSLPDQP